MTLAQNLHRRFMKLLIAIASEIDHSSSVAKTVVLLKLQKSNGAHRQRAYPNR